MRHPRQKARHDRVLATRADKRTRQDAAAAAAIAVMQFSTWKFLPAALAEAGLEITFRVRHGWIVGGGGSDMTLVHHHTPNLHCIPLLPNMFLLEVARH